MQQSYHIRSVLALFAICAVAWMVAQPQAATPSYAQVPPPPPTPTPSSTEIPPPPPPPTPDSSGDWRPPSSPDRDDDCIGDATISGTVLDAAGNPIVGAVIDVDELNLPELFMVRSRFKCGGVMTDENGAFTVTEIGSSKWEVIVWPPAGDDTLFAPPSTYVEIENGDTFEFAEPIIITAAQVTATSTAQDGTTPALSSYELYQPQDFNGDGQATCYLSALEPDQPFYKAFFELEQSTESSYITVDEIARDGQIALGSLPAGDYCLRVAVIVSTNPPYGSTAFPVIEREFSIADASDSIDLGAFVPGPTPKRATVTITTDDGEPVSDFTIYLHKATPPIAGAQSKTDENGTISFDLSGGAWEIYKESDEGLLVDSNLIGEVIFAEDESAESKDVSIGGQMSAPDSTTIIGTVRKPDGSPAIGVQGMVAMTAGSLAEDNWQWEGVEIDSETATFEASVTAGEWQLTYSLYVYSADDEYAVYKPIGAVTTSVSVADGSTATQDVTLIGFDSTVRGSILQPDGTSVSEGKVWIRDNAFTRRPVEIVDGVFETQVLSGVEYQIEVDDESGYFAANKMGVPDLYPFTTTPGSTVDVELQLSSLNASIIGNVYTSDAQPVRKAKVYATAPGGQCIHAVTDELGAFKFNVPAGTTWYVTAYWQDPADYKFHGTLNEAEVMVVDEQGYTLDLTVVPADYNLPQEVDDTFDAAETWKGALSDGTTIEIPADSVPVDNLDGHDVRVVVKPEAFNLPRAYDVNIVRYGIGIQLFNVHTGEEITSALNQNMTVTYAYSDDMLTDMNADESTMGVSLLSNDGVTWEPASSSSINLDENTNVVSISLNQPTAAAVTVRPRRDADEDITDNGTSIGQANVSVFLPMLAK